MERVFAGKGVLMIVQNLPVPFDRRVWMEATTLRAAGLDVAVICPKKKMYTASYEVLDGVAIYRYPLLFEADRGVLGYITEFTYCWLATAVLSLKAYIRRPFHVIHACNPPDTYFALALLFRLFGVRFIFDHHDLSPEMYQAKGGTPGGVLHRALVMLERLSMRSASLVIAVNESHREIAEHRHGIPPERLTIVRSGPRLGWGAGVQPEAALKNGRGHLVVYLGEMCAQDGVDHLLDAIEHYQTTYGKDVHFVLVGGGPDRSRLMDIARYKGLTDTVTFTGRIPDADLWRYLATADVCVDPDPWTDWSDKSTMNKIIEYLAFGRPVVCFDLLENKRSGGEACRYVAPNDARAFARELHELLHDPERRARMSAIGTERFRTLLAWDNASTILVRAYASLFASRSTSRP
jgi:glycosyltransferase involved in cell wall biosynthesis